MDHTRRELLGAASLLIGTAGCLGRDDGTATSTTEATTVSATATASETPTRTPTEEPTATPGETTVRLWPTSVTTVFEGDVSIKAIHDALEQSPRWSIKYTHGEQPLTYFVSSSASFYVGDAESTFAESEDFTVREIYRGVGPKYSRQYDDRFRIQVRERSDVDPASLSVSTGRLGNHQFFDITGSTSKRVLTPMLSELELRRVDDGERIVGPEGFDFDAGFMLYHNGDGLITAQFTLDEQGVEEFTEAVTAASDADLRSDFFRPVVDGEAFRTFSITERFATQVENGDWDGTLRLSFEVYPGDGHVISQLTGLPSIPFMFESSPD